jgi:hypothetical protein
LNDIGRISLLGKRKKIAKFLMRTFTYRSTFLYDTEIMYERLWLENSTMDPILCIPNPDTNSTFLVIPIRIRIRPDKVLICRAP